MLFAQISNTKCRKNNDNKTRNNFTICYLNFDNCDKINIKYTTYVTTLIITKNTSQKDQAHNQPITQTSDHILKLNVNYRAGTFSASF